jgi:hypothetical protein
VIVGSSLGLLAQNVSRKHPLFAGSGATICRLLQLVSQNQRTILNCCRQSGKSTTVAVKVLHGALSSKSLTLLLSRSLRQSGELARKVFDAYEATGRRVPADAKSTLVLELRNGSRIVALPGGDQASIRARHPAARVVDRSNRIKVRKPP